MKFHICQFRKLFLLLTASFVARKSVKTLLVVLLLIAGNVAVEGVIERKFEQSHQQKNRSESQENKQQHQAHVTTRLEGHYLHPIVQVKIPINNTFNLTFSDSNLKQIKTGQVQTSGNDPSKHIDVETPLDVTLTNITVNNVLEMEPQLHSVNVNATATATTTIAPLSTDSISEPEMLASAHVISLMKRGRQRVTVNNDFELPLKKKRSSSSSRGMKQTATMEPMTDKPSSPHLPQPQLQTLSPSSSSLSSSYSSQTLSFSSASTTSSLSLSPSLLSLKSQHYQQSVQQPKAQSHDNKDSSPLPSNHHSQTLLPKKQKQQPSIAATTTKHNGRVAILVPSQLFYKMHVQQGFYDFVEFFQVNLNNVIVDFIPDDDLTTFIKLLEQPNYTTVVKTLNAGINLDDDDLHEGVFAKMGQTQDGSNLTSNLIKEKENEEMKGNKIMHETGTNDNVGKSSEDLLSDKEQILQRRFKQHQQSLNIGYCHMAKALQYDFNKTVLLWPCPNMKESSNFLPSYEAISFAVKSIATKLNWTQVDIFVGDENWALPMAIAANMHIPYKIEIGEDDIRDLHAEDHFGKAIIITAPMNDDSTLRLLSRLEPLTHTKVLLIDIVATSFNAENRFYKYLTRINPESALMSNLLLLTVLSDNYRHFLNVAFDDNGINLVQNFRQNRKRKEIHRPAQLAAQQEAANSDWPIHLDKSVTKVLHLRESENNDTVRERGEGESSLADGHETAANSTHHHHHEENKLQLLYEWLLPCPYINKSHHDLNEICQNYQQCLDTVGAKNESLVNVIAKLCHEHFREFDEQRLIEKLRSFIDFFNFYDFLIANLVPVPATPSKDEASALANGTAKTFAKPLINESEHVPKYDFIVLDVVRKGAALTSPISVVSKATGSNSNNGGSEKSFNTTNAAANTSNASNNDRKRLKSLSPTSIDVNATMPRERSAAAFKWRPLLILEQHEIHLKTYITHSIRPGYDDWLLVSTAQLWQCGSICWTIIAISASLLIAIIVASVAAGIAMRNYLLRKRLSKGPNKIVLSSNDFVFPVDSRRVDEGIEAMLCCWLQQLQEFGGPEVDKPDLLKGSIGSLKNLGFLIPGASGATQINGLNGKTSSGSASLARHNPALLDMRARYNGDLVQLKEIPLNGSTELKSKAMDLLVMAHGLRHENINPLIGWLSDPNRTAMVFDYCSRGSLQDVLIMDEIKLDWSFRLSLLTDLVRGMRYLHTSPLRVHGTLTSRNCVVDARWVLKITDYGLPQFYEAQGLQPTPRTAKEMLWCAPELLRAIKPHSHHNHHHSRMVATQAADVYSFGIIMQEVVVRGEPYCMLSLSAEEIIAKIKKPPPLIRPSVSKGAAPPEAINIMRQCWAEQPEMRPDFNSVYERFKLLNHGRKVNFVDTMFQMLEKYSNNLEELIRERTEQLDMERKKTEQLLNRMLPSSVAEKLKMGLAVEPEEFSDVTIYFSDIVGFTTIAAHCTPVQVVDLLNDLYTIFDATINAYNVYKVETIGDAYMVVSGLPVRIPDHAEQIATMALDLLHQSGRFNVKHLPGVPLQLRIGLHTGPCCAGVVGLTMPRYCLFGDTVNTASRMESTGSSWRIHMSQETRNRLEARGGYMIEPRGLIDIKGKGMMNTFWLLGKKGFDKPLPNPPPIGLLLNAAEKFL
ncbi:uncharacterized protein isoform X2 [Musca autumnalis]|uniref:uncharacterized protein isoform X2 n=1 Tax=Musca autumnalis TaxID=221902 RepID=UPI003CF54F5D